MHVKIMLQFVLTKFGGVLILCVTEDVEKLKTYIYRKYSYTAYVHSSIVLEHQSTLTWKDEVRLAFLPNLPKASSRTPEVAMAAMTRLPVLHHNRGYGHVRVQRS